MSRNVRAITLALLLVLVAAPAAQALPREEAPGLVSRMLSWIGMLLSSGEPVLTPVFERAGSSMDPNGDPQSNIWPVPTTDAEGQIDPQ